jgi:hypothetical protein
MIFNCGYSLPRSIQRPSSSTVLIVSVQGDTMDRNATVTYTITDSTPAGVTFANGSVTASQPNVVIGAGVTPILFNASFAFPSGDEGQVIVNGRVDEVRGDGIWFEEPWIVAVHPQASAFATMMGKVKSFFGGRAGGVAIMLAAGLGACHHLTDVPTTSTGVVSLTPTDTTQLADGTVTVTIRADVDTYFRPLAKVDFTTTRGTFFPSGVTATVLPNDSGIARVQLRSSVDAGTAIVTATAAGITRTISLQFRPKLSRGVLALASDASVPVADGASIVNLRVDVDTLVRPVPKVDLTTTLGSFLGASSLGAVSLTPNDSGIVRVQLKAPADSGTAIVSASSAGVTRTIQVPFAKASAQSIQVTTDGFVLKPGLANSTTVTATLFRSIGAPSPGSVVTFFADTGVARDGTFGQFSSRTVTTSTSVATSRFTVGQTTYAGVVTIWAVSSRNGISVSDTARVTVVP